MASASVQQQPMKLVEVCLCEKMDVCKKGIGCEWGTVYAAKDQLHYHCKECQKQGKYDVVLGSFPIFLSHFVQKHVPVPKEHCSYYLECRECGMVHQNHIASWNHTVFAHAAVDKWKCDLCREKFATRLYLLRHAFLTHKPVTCFFCEFQLDTHAQMLKHEERFHFSEAHEQFRLDCAVLAYYEPRAESLLAQERSRLELEKLDKTRKRENIRPYIVGPTVQRRGRIVEQLPPERLNGGNEEKADDPKTAVEAEEDQEAAAEAGQANDDPNLVAGDEPLTVRSRMQVERSGGKNVYKVKRIGK